MISNKKPKLLLHICCGPCASGVIEELLKDFDVIGYFYNPNIWPEDEYKKRSEALRAFLTFWNKDLIERLIVGEYEVEKWNRAVKGLENEAEGEKRCEACFRMRLEEAARKAKELECDFFGTTLTISPYKNTDLINKIGQEVCYTFTRNYNKKLQFLETDFSKFYKQSIEKSKKAGIYRQKYCGCKYSKK